MKITKRNGNVTMYDDQKVARSMMNANAAIPEEELTESMAAVFAEEVFGRLTEENEIITTQEIRACVISVLREKGFPLTAKNYEDYKKVLAGEISVS